MQQCLHTCATGALVLSLRFNGHFPGGPGLASTRMSPFWILLELELKVMVTTRAIRRVKLQSKCHHHQQINAQFFTGWMPFRHLTNCVKALKGAVVPSKWSEDTWASCASEIAFRSWATSSSCVWSCFTVLAAASYCSLYVLHCNNKQK